MARPNWEFIRVDVLLPHHPKLDGLTYPAKWTLIEAWCHCGQHLTDGFVRDRVWRTLGTASARQMLINAGLAYEVPGGYQMHDYLEHQRSRAEVEELRAARAKAGRKGGYAKALAKHLPEQEPQQVLWQNSGKSVAEAEAEAEETSTPRPPVNSSVEVTSDRPTNGTHDFALSFEDERKRQMDALMREYPETV